ncbi:hypothetical protein EC968_005575 [Mortierella alpina]|nr:hypothetical protein EC968_005575 [Mortierella alpina]
MADLTEPVSAAPHVEQPQGDKDPATDAAVCVQMKAHSPISTLIAADGDTKTAVATAVAKGDGEGELGAVSSCNPISNNDKKHAPASEKHEHGRPALSNLHPSLFPTSVLPLLAPNTPSPPPVGTEVAQAHDPASLLSTGATADAGSIFASPIPSTPNTKSFQEDDVVIAEKGDDIAESEIQGHSSLPFSSETMSSTTPQPPLVTADKPSSPGDFAHLETRHMSASAQDTISFQSSTCSSSSSSLSEYLIIGQAQVESELDDQHSERSYSSRDSFYGSGDGEGEHYHEGGETSETSQDSQSEDRTSTPQRTARRRSTQQQQHHHHRSAFSDGHPTDYQQDQQYQYQFIQQQLQQQQQQQQQKQRITQSAIEAADEDESLYSAASASSSSSSSSRTSSPVPEKTRKRRSRRVPQEESRSANPQLGASSSSSSKGSGAPLPALKLPSLSASLGGLSKSIFEFVLASVVCLSLLSCMFAFSYVSSGTKHLLGWYADQHIGQRIRDGIKEREHFVQEALEKIAGEEYAKVKRRSRQQYQQPQQQAPHGHQNRYQQQYQQQREQRQQERDQQQQQRKQEECDRGRLSSAEWQELIRAASMSFMAKFTASPAAAGRRR